MTRAHQDSLEAQACKDKDLNSLGEIDSVVMTSMNVTMEETEVVLRILDVSTLKALTIAGRAMKVTQEIKQLAVIVGPVSAQMVHSVTTTQSAYGLLA